MDAEQDLREHQRQYLDFLDDGVRPTASFGSVSTTHALSLWPQEDQGIYHDKVRDMIRSHGNRLLVNINDLRRKNRGRAMR